jgi:hypothetical protein
MFKDCVPEFFIMMMFFPDLGAAWTGCFGDVCFLNFRAEVTVLGLGLIIQNGRRESLNERANQD